LTTKRSWVCFQGYRRFGTASVWQSGRAGIRTDRQIEISRVVGDQKEVNFTKDRLAKYIAA